jgi:hypothetical protein
MAKQEQGKALFYAMVLPLPDMVYGLIILPIIPANMVITKHPDRQAANVIS